LIAAVRPTRVSSTVLVGAGVYGVVIAADGVLPSVITQQAACQSDTLGLCIAVYSLLSVLLSIVGGAGAGLVVGRRMSFVSATLLALVLALPSAVILAHQGWMWQYNGLPSLLGMASGVLGGLALVVAAAISRGFGHRPARTEAMA
jgi:MFS family permease